jgi:hypothetical protein
MRTFGVIKVVLFAALRALPLGKGVIHNGILFVHGNEQPHSEHENTADKA